MVGDDSDNDSQSDSDEREREYIVELSDTPWDTPQRKLLLRRMVNITTTDPLNPEATLSYHGLCETIEDNVARCIEGRDLVRAAGLDAIVLATPIGRAVHVAFRIKDCVFKADLDSVLED